MKKPTSKPPKTVPPAQTMVTSREEPDAPPLPVLGFPIVGIGASAGGLAAFEAFFTSMPPPPAEPGMAFILVQHLDPNHKSILTELIRRFTRMPVVEVVDGMVVETNSVYIIPPNHDMALISGTLQLLDPAAPRGQRLPIDYFFRSLAQDQHERAIGIILSGTGSDGTLGVRAIKGEGGMVMAQKPESAEYDGMPSSALATGLIDYELPPAKMPAKLMAYAAKAFKQPFRSVTVPIFLPETAMKKVFVLLRTQTGHDFSLYKPSTINRRIERRMAVQQIDAIDDYVKYLQRMPGEVQALFRDLLIGVPSFFRDPEAFQVLEKKIIPSIIAKKAETGVIRVWSSGCSTGEEVYSLAILLAEVSEASKKNFAIQIFATDIDSQAIASARLGIYPASIVTNISPGRLARFFTLEPSGASYRIHKGIRDMVVFSEQDVVKDPPFSKLDLISCRNVMIYMGSVLQKKLIPLFHYALNPGGALFLGTSETTGDFNGLFSVLDGKLKIYQRKEDFIGARRAAIEPFVPLLTAVDASLPSRADGKRFPPIKQSLRELTESELLRQVIAAGALVNGQGDIHYLHGRTGMFLEPTPGEAGINNILKMAREGLRNDLATALHKAAGTRGIVCHPGLRVKTNGHFTTVNLTVRPVTTGAGASPESPLYLVILEEAGEPGPVPAATESAGSDKLPVDARIAALKDELRSKEEHLQSANEEMQSSNEELKSSNEELQSVNEELSTVNMELQIKMLDLTRANDDMNNLVSGTGIATVFVDLQLRILRFTSGANEIIHLIPVDVGRPVAHIVSNLVGYDRLVADAQSVLDTLIPKEAEVQTTQGNWYTLRIVPYRTLANVIEGAVITFVDITEIVKTREVMKTLHQKMALMLNSITDGLLVLDCNWRYTNFSETGAKLIGMRREDIIGKCVWDLFPATKDTLFDKCFRQAVATRQTVTFEEYYPAPIDKWLECSCYPSAEGLSVYFHDITVRKQAEESLRKANELLRLAVVVRDSRDAITVQDLEGRTIAWNPGAVRLYGWNETEALAMNVRDRIPTELREEALTTLIQLSRAEILAPYHTRRMTKGGAVVAVSITSTALVTEAGTIYAIATTERKTEAVER